MLLFLVGFVAVTLILKGKGQDLSLASSGASALGLSPAEYLGMVSGPGRGYGPPTGSAGLLTDGQYADAQDMGTDPEVYAAEVVGYANDGSGDDPILTFAGEYEATTGAPILYDDQGQRCLVGPSGQVVPF
jgi:hypothetical protein